MRERLEQIHYVVLHPTEGAEKMSAFQGYGIGLLETSFVFSVVSRLPFNIRDFHEPWSRVLDRRMRGDGCSVTPLQIDALSTFLSFGFPFVCVCSPSETAAAAKQAISAAKRPIHHVVLPPIIRISKQVNTGTAIRLVDDAITAEASTLDEARSLLTYEKLLEYVTQSVAHLFQSGSAFLETASRLRELIGEPLHDRTPTPLGLPSRSHFVTAPTEAALSAIGFTLPEAAEPPEGADQEYSAAIANVASQLIDIRGKAKSLSPSLHFFTPCDVIVAAPALMAHWYEARNRRIRPPRGDASRLRMVANELASQEGYAWASLSHAAQMAFTSGEGVALQWQRRMELQAFSSQLEVRAAADAAPVIRLPYGVNLSRVHAIRLAKSARISPRANRVSKSNRFARALSDSLASAIPESLLSIIRTAGPKVKLVSDAPLEWTPIGAVPLLLHSDCTRIPATPGNTSFATTVSRPELVLPLDSFKDVLVLRSFEMSDPVRPFLEHAVSTFIDKTKSRMGIRIIDVSSLDEIRQALDSFAGSVVVFDAHGSAGTTLSPGTLRIGKSDVDLGRLRGTVRVPPIAVLSACDTHAFDSSYATVSNALLSAGATTVVGTTLPVDARYASIFLARLLYRIDTFLPLDLRGPFGVSRWSRMLPGLRRMNYVTEMLRLIDRKNGIRITDEIFLKAGFIGNTYINGWDGTEPPGINGDDIVAPTHSNLYLKAIEEEIARGSPDAPGGASAHWAVEYPTWLGAVLRLISIDCGVSPEAVKQAVREWAWITDALKYIELGNPERLLIVRDAEGR